MPYLTEIIDEGTGVLHVGSGVLSGQDILDAMVNTEANMPHLERLTHGLIDLTGVSDCQVSNKELRIITDRDNRVSERVTRARVAIAAPEDIMFGVSRMYGGMISNPGWTVGVFRTLSEARDWLYSQHPPKA